MTRVLIARSMARMDLGLFLSGGALAILIVIGRWNPQRLFQSYNDAPILLDVRFPLIFVLVLGILLRRPRVVFQVFCTAALLVCPILYMLLSVLWAPSTVNAAYIDQKCVEAALLAISILAVPLIARDQRDRRVLLFFILAGAGAVVLLSFLAFAVGANPVLAATGRLAVLGGGPNILARLAFAVMIISLHLAMEGRRPHYLALFGISLIVLLLTGSRGGLVSAVGSLVVWTICFVRGGGAGKVRSTVKRSRIWLRRYLLLLALGASAFAAIYYLPGLSGVRSVFEYRMVQLTLKEHYFSERDSLTNIAVEQWQLSPVVGMGIASFSDAGTTQLYPHNIFLEFLSEGGAVGLLLFAAPLFALCYQQFRGSRDPVFLSLFWGALIAAQFSGDLYDSRIVFIYGLLAMGGASKMLPR